MLIFSALNHKQILCELISKKLILLRSLKNAEFEGTKLYKAQLVISLLLVFLPKSLKKRFLLTERNFIDYPKS